MRELNQTDLNSVYGASRGALYAEMCGILGTYALFAGVALGATCGGLTTNTISGAVAYGIMGGATGAILGGIVVPAVIYGSYTAIRDANLYLGAQ